MGIKTTGEQCTRQDTGFVNPHARHLQFCQIHWNVYNGHVETRERLTVVVAEHHHRVGTCHKWIPTSSRWCGQMCEGGNRLCTVHLANQRQMVQRREAAREAERQENGVVQAMYEWYIQQNMTWRQAIDNLTAPNNRNLHSRRVLYRIARRMFIQPVVNEPEFDQEWQFAAYWAWAINGQQGPPPNLNEMPQLVPPPMRPVGLAAIVRDPQNVHTAVVSNQTNKGLEKLLEASKEDKAMRAPEWFAAKWLIRSYGRWDLVVRAVNDMQHWYTMSYCKSANDFLYRRTLDGLYIVIQQIKDNSVRMELYKRVFEECFDSIGMCCEGHISRLCNVLVGFDDAFAPPVPFGEVLQNKMAAIAALEIETEEKVKQATAFFNEFAVPETERAAWLEAF